MKVMLECVTPILKLLEQEPEDLRDFPFQSDMEEDDPSPASYDYQRIQLGFLSSPFLLHD